MGLVALDEGILQNQRFKLTVGYNNVKIRNFIDHGRDFGQMIAVEVAADAVFQFFCLADIDNL